MPGGHETRVPGGEGGGIVWVPRSPGSLLRPAPRARDDLDELIDELLPDTTEGPGPADAALVAAGGVVLGWTVIGSPPAVATTAGAVALGLGCILPGRTLWRRLVSRRRARHGSALASRASPLRADDALVARLVAGYEEVDAGVNALTRLDDVIEEVQDRARRR